MQIKLVRKSQSWLFWHPADMTITIGDTIYLADSYYALDAIEQEALLRHEKTHIEQWHRDGLYFAFKYLFSKKHRKSYELEAYERQVKFLVIHRRTPNSVFFAELMAYSYAPFFTWVTYEEAHKHILNWIKE